MRKASLDQVFELAKQDPRVFFIGSDLGAGTLDEFRKTIPDRFFMEGISEAHIIGMAAGLALEGKIPYINTISTFFSRRALEQIILDLCLHHVPVRLIANGGGLVYAPLGPTHLAIDDISLLRTIPNMTVIAPCDAEEMKRCMKQTLDYPGPIYIRVAKGGDPVVSVASHEFKIGRAIEMRSGNDVLIVTTGVTLKPALEAADALNQRGIQTGVLHMHTIKPLDHDALIRMMGPVRAVVAIEENTVIGGLGSAVAEVLAEANFPTVKKFRRIGVPDVFPDEYGSQASLMNKYSINVNGLISVINGFLG